METEKNTAVVKTNGTSPAALLQIAVEQNVDIEKLGKLMDLQERWNAQQAKKAFLGAMSLFQSKCPVLQKNKTVGYKTKAGGTVGYNYTTLGEISQKIKGILQECGLSYRWETQTKENLITITCIVSHLDGHSEKNTMEGLCDTSGQKNEIQQRGSTITYLQRYTLIGALGISTADVDNDGGKKEPEKKPDLTPAHEKWDDAKKAWRAGSVTIDGIKAKYTLTDKHEKMLCS